METISSNPAFSPVLHIPPPPALRAHIQQGAALPSVPTLLATRLQLELLLSGRTGSVDLREAAGVILNDLGATLEVFRLAGEECCESGGAPGVASRLEDCLASLGTETWMDAVCANAVERIAGTSGELSTLTAFWEHGRSVAYACWLLSEHEENVCPEEAYLAGLLHEMGELPRLLGWTPSQFGGVDGRWTVQSLALLAKHWRLPAYLAELVAKAEAPSRWTGLLETAHAWSHRNPALLSCIA